MTRMRYYSRPMQVQDRIILLATITPQIDICLQTIEPAGLCASDQIVSGSHKKDARRTRTARC